MKKIAIIIFLSISSLLTKAQPNTAIKTTKPSDALIFKNVQHPPEFPGGISKFNTYIAKNLRYPEDTLNDIQGRITLQMIIEKNGSISIVTLLNIKSKALRNEVKRVFLNSPKWKPGLQNGKPVRVSYPFSIACIMPSID